MLVKREIICISALLLANCLQYDLHAQYRPESTSPLFLIDTAIHIQDSDGDGLPDWWETFYFGGPTNADANAMLTGDGLTTIEKYNGGWNPFSPQLMGFSNSRSPLFTLTMANLAADSDGDGLPDWWELLYFGGVTNAIANIDSSGDGLTNIQVYNAGWNPLQINNALFSSAFTANHSLNTGGWLGGYGIDTDNDGMPDWWEHKYGMNPLVDDADEDIDTNGIFNLTEYQLGLIPFGDGNLVEVWVLSPIFALIHSIWSLDTDGDNLPDWWEELHFGNPTNAQATAITADDGLTNLEKYNAGWNPWHAIIPSRSRSQSIPLMVDTGGWPGGYGADTDGDGMPDWWETKYFSNPTNALAQDNVDNDGRTNIEEYLAGRNPILFDSFVIFEFAEGNIFFLDTGGRYSDEDADGIPDWWERRYSGNSTGIYANAIADATEMTFLQKYIADLDPTDPASSFLIDNIEAQLLPNTTMIISWSTSNGRLYRLYANDALSTPWPTNHLYQILGTGNLVSYTNEPSINHPRYFKLTVELLTP